MNCAVTLVTIMRGPSKAQFTALKVLWLWLPTISSGVLIQALDHATPSTFLLMRLG
ncbi:MAG: hypothetical protein K0S73_2636 [Stenotrophomonas rhizophila]|jgi:hypothetical protein|nr:hypothetical protein [Stenotrophomonas rhizophila]